MVTIHTDEWRMPLARLPRAQVPSTDIPEVAGLAPPAALTFAGRLGALWGHCVQSRSCCSSVFFLKIPTGGFLISLCRTQLCPPTPQRQQGEHLGHHQLQREVRRPHPPQSWAPGNRVKETRAPRARAVRESPGSSASLCVLPGPEGPSQSGGCLSLGSLRIWNPGVLGQLRYLFST